MVAAPQRAHRHAQRGRMISRRLVGPVVACLLVGACSTAPTYRYAGRAYRTAEEAAPTHGAELAAAVARVTATAHPLGGLARVMLPSRERVGESALWGQSTTGVSAEMIDHIVTSITTLHRAMVDAIKRRAVFDDVS